MTSRRRTTTCLDCGAWLASKSPRCPEHRAEHRRQQNRAHYARWATPENVEAHRARQHARNQLRRRPAQMARLHALADQLGYILVPIG